MRILKTYKMHHDKLKIFGITNKDLEVRFFAGKHACNSVYANQNRRACFLISEFLQPTKMMHAHCIPCVYKKSTLDTPPPSIITSGSSIATTFPSPTPKSCRNSSFHCISALLSVALSLLVVFLHFQLDLTISLQVHTRDVRNCKTLPKSFGIISSDVEF